MWFIKRILWSIIGGLIAAILFSTIFTGATGGLLGPICALSFPLQWIIFSVVAFFVAKD